VFLFLSPGVRACGWNADEIASHPARRFWRRAGWEENGGSGLSPRRRTPGLEKSRYLPFTASIAGLWAV
jgi:hypothetical protein